ncbi:putative Ankyrin repeat family protein [Melia azedarach]|uniref:Ankyrin repeat family protein n=1 Tax=Melia azedarach TaxID=155640 RepID=A0ACC1WV53_MELAZ|nr:putative Ankyrin repeat family protein [Melia azedarach]
MARELEIQIDDQQYHVEKMRDAYSMALRRNWQGFQDYYRRHPNTLFNPLTVNGDNAFHFAAGSRNPQLVRALLDLLPNPSEKFAAVTTTDDLGNTPLHEVATKNCVEAAQHMVAILLDPRSWPDNEDEKKKHIRTAKGLPEDKKKLPDDPKKLLMRNKSGATPLYMAAADGKKKMTLYLATIVEQIDPNLLHHHFRKNDELSVLHMAVMGQHFDTAIWLLKKEEEFLGTKEYYAEGEAKLAKREEENGMTSFHLLALIPLPFKSFRPMSIFTKLLYSLIPAAELKAYKEEIRLLSSQRKDLESGKSRNENIMNIHPAKNLTTISEIRIRLWTGLVNAFPKLKQIYRLKRKDGLVLQLVEFLVDQDSSWKEGYKTEEATIISLGLGKGASETEDKPKNPTENSSNSSSTTEDIKKKKKKKRSSVEAPLLMAASNGIVEIVDAILHKYPQAVDYVSDRGQNVFHTAVMYRKKKIFDRILELENDIVQRLASMIDKNGNCSLHHVADMRYYQGSRFGAALRYQEELQWFEDVRKIMPQYFILHRNEKRITAPDLFEKEHKQQYEAAQEWMKGTAESCSTVSILVATVVFAAAYTVPGGNDANGVPVFIHSPLFAVFTIMDVFSLITSLCSVVMFLSILTSSFQQHAFIKSLPRKLTIGFSLLFLSVLSSMITFTAALLLLVRLKGRWTNTLVYAAAFIPVLLFGAMQFHIYSQVLTGIINKVKPVFVKKKKHRYI